MEKYFSGYSVTDYAFYDQPPFKGKGWEIIFEEIPNFDSLRTRTYINDVFYPSKAVVINASSLDRAQYVADLLYASYCLQYGSLPFWGNTKIHRINCDDINNDKQEISLLGINYDGLPLICMIAAKASFRKEYQYALFKHLTSHQLISTEIMDRDPSHWWPGQFVHFSAAYHVHCAYAIVIAYSVVEELSLELRASSKEPSITNGKWNPVVKEDLENRLRKAGIDLSDTILWVLRDTPTKIERVRLPKIQSKASWAYRKIRDSEVEITDAIAQTSWLRSKVSAHKLRELASSLNYYDVANVQHLARRLLLERLGFWQDQEEDFDLLESEKD